MRLATDMEVNLVKQGAISAFMKKGMTREQAEKAYDSRMDKLAHLARLTNSICATPPAAPDELLLCKAAAIVAGVRNGLSPLASLELFNQRLEKYAFLFKTPDNYTTLDKADHTNIAFWDNMRKRGLRNSENIMGFNIQDPKSKQRINAALNGLLSVPVTAGMAAVEGVKNVARRLQPQ